MKCNDEAEKKDGWLRQSVDQDYYKNNRNLEKKDGFRDKLQIKNLAKKKQKTKISTLQ